MLLHVGEYGQCSWSGHAPVLHASVCLQGLDKFNIEKDIAQFIKKEFDRKHSPTWHCIVGRNFGGPEGSQQCTGSLMNRVSSAFMQLNMHKGAFSDVAMSSCRLLCHP
jgi:Dynein light chain type 1